MITKKQYNNYNNKTNNKKNNKTKKNNKLELNLINIKNLYTTIIKKCNKSKYKILEFILNYYLLLKGVRDIFQFDLHGDNHSKDLFKKLIIDKYKINLYKENDNDGRNIIYNNKFDIDKLDKTFGEKYAKQLGKFYVCASNEFGTNNKFKFYPRIRVSIDVSLYESLSILNNNCSDKYREIELYGQMCNRNIINNSKKCNKLLKFYSLVKNVINELDENLQTNIKFT